MPSVSEKQRRFMGADLSRLRSGKKTQTGMSETQLSEFAGSTHKSKRMDKPGRSIVDVEWIDRKPETKTLCPEFTHPTHDPNLDKCGIEYGSLDPPAHDGSGASQFTKGKQSCNRDIGQGTHYGAPIYFHGPDTNFRTEEINPHHYGRDYEPAPFKDLFKTEEKAEEAGIRLREEYEYSEVATPGTVPDGAIESSLAYGAISYTKVPTELDDYRSFDSQRDFRRSQAELEEDAPTVKKLKKY